METEFTPLASLIGGLLIGVGTVLLMWTRGNVFGATGILSGALVGPDRGWRLTLLAGMISGPWVYKLATGALPAVQPTVGMGVMVLGGVIVGMGATYGSGCTSGHGVCGMARLSPRSIVATLVFMVMTGVTVYVIRHVVGG
ncbi:YeeE/YedE family protein [Aliiroseovarius sp.]|uniref:YeeE/YedE family protein n=1 Tax=Aliiroseovarius sp. TaxID=1872442 RepID=UPI00263439FC|nr:YeeE/YedE family protein [Aliiroseovarius sp.]